MRGQATKISHCANKFNLSAGEWNILLNLLLHFQLPKSLHQCQGRISWYVKSFFCFCTATVYTTSWSINYSLLPPNPPAYRYVYTYRFRHRLVKFYHCANGNRPFNGQNQHRTHSLCQTVRHHSHNVNLRELEMLTVAETVRVNEPY